MHTPARRWVDAAAPDTAVSPRRPALYLASLRRADGGVATFDAFGNVITYDKFEQRAYLEAGNQVRTAYSYNPQNRRLCGLVSGKGTPSAGCRTVTATPTSEPNAIQALAYQYDNVGNILGLQNQIPVPPPSSFGGPVTQTFVYDDLYRLTSAQGTFDFNPSKRRSYNLTLAYDSIHNILSKQQTDIVTQPSGTPITQKKTSYVFNYSYGTKPHAPTHIGNRTFSYDANGNQLGWEHDDNGTRRTIVWDEENRIQSLFDNGHEKTYQYDDQGQRIIKRGPQGETAYINQYFTMRNREVGTKHVFVGATRLVSKLMKQDKPGANPHGNTPVEKDLYFFHPDHLGSSNYITDTNGKLYEHLEYFPFGETWVEENSNTQRTPYLFTGKELDEETGLYYFGARYYDPRTSVWQSGDPALAKYLPSRGRDRDQNLPGMGGVYTSPNIALYTYSHQNPLKYTDPDGRFVQVLVPVALVVGTAIIVTTAVTLQTRQNPGYQPVNVDTSTPGFFGGALEGFKTLVTTPGKAWENFKENTGLGNLIFNEAKTPEEFFRPGGKNIGEPGDSSGVRIMPGGAQGAQEKFGEAVTALGGKIVDKPTYPGTAAELPGGGFIGLRPESKSEPATIDVNVPGLGVREIKFPE